MIVLPLLQVIKLTMDEKGFFPREAMGLILILKPFDGTVLFRPDQEPSSYAAQVRGSR